MVYICSHKPDEVPYNLGCPYKIVNNNCSELSENYRHLRGMKLILDYEDPLPDEIAIFQHRRFFEYGSIPEGYDIVVAKDFGNFNIYAQYAGCHNIKDLNICEQVINDEHFSHWLRKNDNTETYMHNMFIMKKSDYQKYCEFLFSVLAGHDILAESDKDDCFLAERLGAYWIAKNIPPEKRFITRTMTVR